MVLGNLIEVRKNHSFNIKNLQAWIQTNIKNFGKILTIKQFIGGQSNPTFLIIFLASEIACLLSTKASLMQNF